MSADDRGHFENCPRHESSIDVNGSCHCDAELDSRLMKMGMECSGWKSHSTWPVGVMPDYYWRETSAGQSIKLTRGKGGWEYRWIRGEETLIGDKSFGTPRHAIDALYESMKDMFVVAANYQLKINNFRNAFDELVR